MSDNPVIFKASEPKYDELARVATKVFGALLTKSAVKEAVAAEILRQLGGLPPSEGLPDIRPNYPRWEQK